MLNAAINSKINRSLTNVSYYIYIKSSDAFYSVDTFVFNLSKKVNENLFNLNRPNSFQIKRDNGAFHYHV
jgi:hypothetical protein